MSGTVTVGRGEFFTGTPTEVGYTGPVRQDGAAGTTDVNENERPGGHQGPPGSREP